MTTVKITYDPDLSKVGTTREVDAKEARRLVKAGRAVRVESVEELVEHSKAELVAQAASLDLDVSSHATKVEIAEQIADAELDD